jgi:hypothetical protein
MSTIDAIAQIIKGVLLGALGGLLIPTAWMSVVFGGPTFIQQFSDGSNIVVILTSLIAIPFSTLWRGLLDGGLLTTVLFGAATGAVIGLLTLIIRQFTTKRASAIVSAGLALVVVVVLVLTQSGQITLATGLTGAQIWVLAALYVLGAAWLGYTLREVSVA